jgi:hypothetical protein
VLALLGYTAVSCALFAWRLLPHPGQELIGFAPEGKQRDPEIFAWSFAWWPHAIGHWTNPFFTHEIYAPVGVNLTWTTSVPALALAFSPVTWLFGPDVSYNVAALLLPAVAAWTAFILCRYLTGSVWAALVGGYLFGFSSYVLGHEDGGHLNLTGVFLVPLVALAVVRYVREEIGGAGLTWRLGVTLAVELLISTEVTVTLTVSIVLGVLLGLALLPAVRARLLRALLAIGAGYLLAGILAAPFLVYVAKGFVHTGFADPAFFDGDLLNVVVPTHLTGIGGSALESVSRRFPGNDNERGLYLGLPLLLIVAVYAVRGRRAPEARYLVGGLVLALVLALGTSLHVEGHRLVALPWAAVVHRPVIDNVLPARFSLYLSLAAAVAAALWIGTTRGRLVRRPVVLPLLAVASLVPAVWQVDFAGRPERWSFFTQGLYKLCVPRGETLAVFPFGRWGDSMLWQAESGFWFRMAEGSMGRDNYPPNFVYDPIVSMLQFGFIDPSVRPTVKQLRSYAETHRVDRFASVQVHAYPDGNQLHRFGPLQVLGGVMVSPACGYNSLAGDTRRIPGD